MMICKVKYINTFIIYILMSFRPQLFLEDKNIKMLWEVILDDDIAKNKSQKDIIAINEIFVDIAQQFYNRDGKQHSDLFSMNKTFISIIINFINTNFLTHQQSTSPKLMEIKPSQSIRAEDISVRRLNDFEKEFTIKQDEFKKAMTLPVPETPLFADNSRDEPLSELDVIIKRTIAQRNIEMQEINNNNINKSEVEKWIKGVETSVKNENTRENQNAMKLIKIEKNDLPVSFAILDLNEKQCEKHITWGENNFHQYDELNHAKLNEINVMQKQINNIEIKVNDIFRMIEKLLQKKIDL